MSETYLIRADASPKIGAGHVMRTLALGQMLRDHGQSVHYATTTTTRAILDRIADEGFVLHRMQGEGEIDGKMHDDSMYCLETARRIDAKWIILDGYQFGTSYQRSVKSSGFNLMCIDDMASCHIVADVVVNQNIKACDIRYSIEPYTRLYAGPHHALMRSEFIQEKGRLHRNPSRKIKNILVTMGASNIDTIILQVLKGLECSHLPRICIKAVLGSDQSHDDEIRSFIESSHHHIEFMRNVGPEMARLMAWADLGIFGCGSTVLEGRYLDLPMICFQLVDNQKTNCAPSSTYDNDLYAGLLSSLSTVGQFFVMADFEVSPFDVTTIL